MTLEEDLSPADAIALVRKVRVNAIETRAQESYLFEQRSSG
jgi:hypothetical protein